MFIYDNDNVMKYETTQDFLRIRNRKYDMDEYFSSNFTGFKIDRQKSILKLKIKSFEIGTIWKI